MAQGLVFSTAIPAVAARALDTGSIHLWRIRHALSEGRAPLIGVLAAYTGLDPDAIELVDAEGGKPRLSAATQRRMPAAAARAIEFNWSHSGDYALIALSLALPLGVDIEHRRPRLRALEIAQRFFAPAEAEALGALDPSTLDRAFIALWCAKEALLKARGKGLAFGLTRVAFAPSPGGAWQPLAIDAALGGTCGWRLMQFEAAAGYRGALAWRGDARSVRAFRPSAT